MHRDQIHIQIRIHSDNIKLKQFYNKFRNKLTFTIREAKALNYQAKILKPVNNKERCYKIINEAFN